MKLGYSLLLIWLSLAANASAALIGHYEFEGNATDSSPLGNHGTLEDDARIVTDPERGLVLDLRGAGRVLTSKVGFLDINMGRGDKITLCCWVKLRPEPTSGFQWFISTRGGVDRPFTRIGKWGGSTGGDFFLDCWLGSFPYIHEGTSGGQGPYGERWHHIAGIYDGSQLILYVDGLVTGSPYKINEPLGGIENWNIIIGESCNCLIDDVRIYNHALSASDIRLLAQNITPLLPGRASNPTPANGAIGVIASVVGWTAGSDATSHDVYFGTTPPGFFQGSQNDTAFDAGTLAPGTTYYWRVDENNAAGTTTDEVWSFTTAGGVGLLGHYYNWSGTAPPSREAAFGSCVLSCIDPQINFNWGAGSPATGVVNGDRFAVRWVGEVEPAYSETYTFYTHTDGGVRLWVDDRLLIDCWAEPSPTEQSGTISLLKGRRYSIRMEYYTSTGNAFAKLLWSSPSTPKALVPQVALFLPLNLMASMPHPADGATCVEQRPTLTWKPGIKAAKHDVYLGDDEAAVAKANTSTAGIYRGRFDSNAYTVPENLELGHTYYWRVDEVNGLDLWRGSVWSFTTALGPGPAYSSPPDGATGVRRDPVLIWGAGAHAVSHDVYFGTDPTAVANANFSSPEYKGTQTSVRYNPGVLDLDRMYYWRIDERDKAGNLTKGEVWSFKTEYGWDLTIPAGLGSGSPTIQDPFGPLTGLNLFVEAGFRVARWDYQWELIETTKKGIYDFTKYDKALELWTGHGIRPYFILDYGNTLYEPAGSSVRTDAGRAAFVAFAKAAATRCKGRNVIWEIWNEPNIFFWSPPPSAYPYAQLVKAVAPVIKEADPTCRVVACATSEFPYSWFEEVFSYGILEHVDAVSVHPYRKVAPESVANRGETDYGDYPTLRDIINKYAPPGKTIPLISSEWGYGLTGGYTAELDENLQAAFVVRMHLINLWQQVPITIWFDWTDWGNMGQGIVTGDFQKKPAWHAVRTLSQTLNSYKVEGRISVESDRDYVLKLSKGGQTAYALWTRDEPHNITLQMTPGSGTLIEMLGSKSDISWGNTLTIQVSKYPRYLKVREGRIFQKR